MSRIDAAKERRAAELLAKGWKRAAIVKATGLGAGTVSRIKAQSAGPLESLPKKTQSDVIAGNNRTLSLDGTRICTEDGLVAHCKIDLTRWEIVRFECNKWEVAAKFGSPGSERMHVEPLFQVKAVMQRKVAASRAIDEIQKLRAEALKYSPKFPGIKLRKTSGSGVAVEHAIADHHFGALIWGKETGGENWDNKIALRTWKDAFEGLMSRTDGYKPELAVIPFGHDQLNADNRQGSTENLTPQQMDGRYQKLYDLSKEASRWAIDTALARYGRVHVPIVPGNHDPLASWHLGDYLKTWYRNCPGVTIDNGEQQRKWWEWGVVMLLLEHGHKGKLPDYDRIMASEQSEMWGRTKWREAHTGHIHHKQLIEQKGALIRSLSSLRPPCSWGAENHHTGSIRAAESFVWCKAEGLIGQATYSILQRGKVAA